MVIAVPSAPIVCFSARDEMRCSGRHHLPAPGCFRLRMPTRLATYWPVSALHREERIRDRRERSMMQQTQLEAIAQAVMQRQERYHRNRLLSDQVAQFLLQGRPVAPALLA